MFMTMSSGKAVFTWPEQSMCDLGGPIVALGS
jgi:hypothetical protein